MHKNDPLIPTDQCISVTDNDTNGDWKYYPLALFRKLKIWKSVDANHALPRAVTNDICAIHGEGKTKVSLMRALLAALAGKSPV